MLRREKDKYCFMVCWEAICLWKIKKLVCHYTCNKKTNQSTNQTTGAKTTKKSTKNTWHDDGWSCFIKSNGSSQWTLSINYMSLGPEDSGGHPWSTGGSMSGFSLVVSEMDIWRHWFAWKEHFQNRELW